jgi:DNA-binding response OmpR family regulator
VDGRAKTLLIACSSGNEGIPVDAVLTGRSILVVEDDVVLATDLTALLTESGCRVVLPTTSIAAALSTIVHYVVDAAILDVNVQNEWVFPVAHALERARIPFLFLTAYAADSIPAEHRDKPFVQKPHIPRELIGSVVRLLAPDEPEVKLATLDGEPVPNGDRDPSPKRRQGPREAHMRD